MSYDIFPSLTHFTQYGTFSRSIHVATNSIISSFLIAEYYSIIYVCVCTTSSLSSVDGHLGSFHVLVVVKSAAVNIGVHVSF